MSKKVFRFLMFLSLAPCLNSCRKSEINVPITQNLSVINKAVVEKFLTPPENAGPELKAIINDLRKAEEAHPFLSDQIGKNGMADWGSTIAANPLLTTNPRQVVSSSLSSAAGFLKIYFIPLLDSTTREVKSFLYCQKTGDSTYGYMLYNKREILNDLPRTTEAVSNAKVLMNVFATFERKINQQGTFVTPPPYANTYLSADIKFIQGNFRNTEVKADQTAKREKQIKTDGDVDDKCIWIDKFQTVLFTVAGMSESIPFEWHWIENICTHAVQLVSITRVGGSLGGGSGSGSSGSGGYGDGGSNGGGGWGNGGGGGFSGNLPGGSDPGMGGYNPGAPSYPMYPAMGTDPFGYTYGPNNPLFTLTPAGSGSVAFSLAHFLPVDQDQIIWLGQNPEFAEDLYEALQENDISPEAVSAAMITIQMERLGLHNSPLDPAYEATLNSYHPQLPSTIPILSITIKYQAMINTNMAMLKIEHPNWKPGKLWFYAHWEMVHTALDVVGLFPGVGEVADIVNGIIYTIQGDGTMAALSYSAAIPVWGWVSAGAKMAKRTVVTAGGTTALKWVMQTNNKISFGLRTQLRKVIGLAKGDPRQAHHIIPWEHLEDDVVQLAAQAPGTNPFHMNELLNGIGLDKTIHVEGMAHPMYNSRVKTALNDIRNSYLLNNQLLTPAAARAEIDALIGKIRTWIEQHPGVSLENIIIP